MEMFRSSKLRVLPGVKRKRLGTASKRCCAMAEALVPGQRLTLVSSEADSVSQVSLSLLSLGEPGWLFRSISLDGRKNSLRSSCMEGYVEQLWRSSHRTVAPIQK